MHTLTVILVLLALVAVGYRVGLTRSRRVALDSARPLHSRPVYYGVLLALWCALPALVVFSLWAAFGKTLSRLYIIAGLPPDVAGLSADRIATVIARIRRIASGLGVTGDTAP